MPWLANPEQIKQLPDNMIDKMAPHQLSMLSIERIARLQNSTLIATLTDPLSISRLQGMQLKHVTSSQVPHLLQNQVNNIKSVMAKYLTKNQISWINNDALLTEANFNQLSKEQQKVAATALQGLSIDEYPDQHLGRLTREQVLRLKNPAKMASLPLDKIKQLTATQVKLLASTDLSSDFVSRLTSSAREALTPHNILKLPEKAFRQLPAHKFIESINLHTYKTLSPSLQNDYRAHLSNKNPLDMNDEQMKIFYDINAKKRFRYIAQGIFSLVTLPITAPVELAMNAFGLIFCSVAAIFSSNWRNKAKAQAKETFIDALLVL